ncbi:hypothetical protein [Candidatus Methylomirabilis sp.]|uniref:hypothetical protein n=1 Tax=Candidatus Methylomirabilis sp. TaxID=2032687 RepID=UPI002A698292|nr:hypothetical protein [Candidatus Methylomirabilis sp.]
MRRLPSWLLSRLTLCLALTMALWLATSSTTAASSLTVAPGALSFVAIEGGANPPGQVIAIIASGPNAVSWFATGGASWLQVMPSAGEAPASVFVSANVAGMAAGTYSGTILITARQAGIGSRVVSVSLTVTPQSAPSQ